jgi:hypothetical protein
MLKKKIWANFQRIIELYTQKNVTPGSQIQEPERHRIPDPDPDPQHWWSVKSKELGHGAIRQPCDHIFLEI